MSIAKSKSATASDKNQNTSRVKAKRRGKKKPPGEKAARGHHKPPSAPAHVKRRANRGRNRQVKGDGMEAQNDFVPLGRGQVFDSKVLNLMQQTEDQTAETSVAEAQPQSDPKGTQSSAKGPIFGHDITALIPESLELLRLRVPSDENDIPSIEEANVKVQPRFANKLACRENRDYCKRFAKHANSLREAQQNLQNFRGKRARVLDGLMIDYVWCRFYPAPAPWWPPLRRGSKRSDVTLGERGKQRFSATVERCIREGTLEELRECKHGYIGQMIAQCQQEHDEELDASAGLPEGPAVGETVEVPVILSDTESVLINLDESEKMSSSSPRQTSASRDLGLLMTEPSDDSRPPDLRKESSTPTDAMMDYADADQDPIDRMNAQASDPVTRKEQTPDQDSASKQSASENGMTSRKFVRDLSLAEQIVQRKYFYFYQASDDILDQVVHCLVCGGAGHCADQCEDMTCHRCSAYNKHHSTLCYTLARCFRCKEHGHQSLDCPHKLKRHSTEDIVCELCMGQGHEEYVCEVFWRSGRQPSTLDFSSSTIRLGCYECGNSSHLGNDCPSRRPRKQRGTSTWSLRPGPPIPFVPNESLIANGSRSRRPFPRENDREQNGLAFPKTRPAAPPAIQVRIGNGSDSQTYRPSWNDDRRPRDGPSPSSYSHGRGYAGESYRPYMPSGQSVYVGSSRPHASQDNTYRPMPSSAQQAWQRHRA